MFFKFVAFLVIVGCLGGCAQQRLSAVPVEATSQAKVFAAPNIRFYLDSAGVAAMSREGALSVQRERAHLARIGKGPALPTANFLALSGGGDDGAFGAGLLVGWSARGGRPQFKLVTGISTGALAAPLAFLGPEYDDALKQVYTETSAADIFVKRSVFAAVVDDAMADNTPLYNMISKIIDDRMVVRIAEEYKKGRLLLIATTNLDAARPVIWNIGAIADSGQPGGKELIKRVLLASAAIPAAFPPVLFDAEVDGKRFQELHVDGGAIAQTFLYPAALTARGSRTDRRRVAYIVRDGRLWAPWQEVERKTLTIAGRAVAALTAANGVGDLYRIYATVRRDGVEFNLAYIDDDFAVPYKGPFDRGYMSALFEYGFQLARDGYRWKKVPPGYSAVAGR